MAADTPFVAGRAERLLRVAPVCLGETASEFVMGTGPWLSDARLGTVRGALAVPLDDATGYLVAAGVPDGKWPVSLSMRLDIVAELPVDGSSVRLVGELVGRTAAGAVTRGVAYDESGKVLAVLAHQSHLIDIDRDSASWRESTDEAVPTTALRDAFGFASADDGVTMSPTGWAANSMGNVHGGVQVVAAEIAAHEVVGSGFLTVSVDTTYSRPGDVSSTVDYRATVVRRGVAVAVVRVDAVPTGGRSCATSTVVLRRLIDVRGA